MNLVLMISDESNEVGPDESERSNEFDPMNLVSPMNRMGRAPASS